MCGRTDLLKLKDKQGFHRAGLVDMSRVLGDKENSVDSNEQWKKSRDIFDFALEKTVDEKDFLTAFEKLTSKENGIPAVQINITDKVKKELWGQSLVVKFKRNMEILLMMILLW